MLKHIIGFSLKHAGLILGLAAILIGSTWYGLKQIPVDVFPELTAPTVTIMTESGGLAADEVEQFITRPIESSVNGLPGLRRVRSGSALGLSIIYVEFDWDVDIYRARQMVNERLSLVAEELPADAHSSMAPINSITGEIMLLAVSSNNPDHSELDIRSYAEFNLRKQLLSVQGISQVVVIGGRLPEYQIEVKQETLQQFNLTTEQVADALRESHNTNSAGFLVNIEGLELPLRQTGRVQSIEDIKQTVVSYDQSTPITIADVAQVTFGGAFRRGTASDNAEAAVVISVQKAPGTNTLALTDVVDQVLNNAQQTIPSGMHINRNVFRQSEFINRSVNNVTSTLVEAIILVSIIVFLFLMHARTTFITLTALPLSLAATLLAMWGMGLTLNVMTLGGLAVAIGVLVDDAIIDVENVFRRLQENARLPEAERQSILKVIFDASNEIRSSIVFATAIICIVFVPLLFLGGLEGRFFKPLALTYMIAVGSSLIVALTVTPAMCALLLRKGWTGEQKESWFVHKLKSCYRPVLAFSLRWKKGVLNGAIGLIFVSILLLSSFGSSFLPKFNEGTYTVFLMMPFGTSLEESDRLARGFESQLLEIDGIEHVVRRTGRAELDEHAEPPSNSEIEVRMNENADPDKVLASIDGLLAQLPKIKNNIGQPIGHRLSHVLSGTKAQIAIDIYGNDLDVLRELAETVTKKLKGIKGTRDVVPNPEILIQTLPIQFRKHDLARYGLTPDDAGRQIRRAAFGEHITTVNHGIKRYNMTLRLAQDQRDSIEDIRNLVLIGKNGAYVRLFEVADIGRELASNLISRQHGKRKTVIACNVANDSNLGDVIARVRSEIDPIVTAAGCEVEYGGQFEAQQAASKTIVVAGGLILVVMFILLTAALGAYQPALIVMINIPLALIGGVLAMFFTTSQHFLVNLGALFGLGGVYQSPVLSIASMVGFITLFGIAVRNGILLVNHYRWLRLHTKHSFDEIVIIGSQERLVPVLMTALSAALGLLPLALKAGQPGSELLAPLAVVVLGGLLSATLLNMLVIPVAYHLFCKNIELSTDNKDSFS